MFASPPRPFFQAFFSWLSLLTAFFFLGVSAAQEEQEALQVVNSSQEPKSEEIQALEDEQASEVETASSTDIAPDSLTLTELAPVLRNPWVGVAGGLILMLVLRFIYNYGRR